MASIHRDSKGKSPFWQAAFTGPDGRRRLVSTKQTDKSKAMQTAVLWEHHAKRARQRLLTEAQGRKIIAEFVEFSTGQEMSFYTCRAWLDEWTEKRTIEAAETTRARYKQIIRDFLAFMGDRADLPLRTVKAGDILGFRDKLRKEGRAASTCNTVIRKILSIPFRLARELGYIEINPASPAALGLQLEDKKTETGREPFTADEIKKLIKAAEGEWKGAILLAATTGLRLGDVTGLEWENVDLEKGALAVKTTKTGKSVQLPMHPDFTAWLKKQPRGIGKAPIFPKLSSTRMGGDNGLSGLFMGIVSDAGIVQRTVERAGKGRATNSKTFHSLRHSFISMLANAGVSPELRQKLAAHEDAAVHEKYTHHETATLAAAIAKLPRLATK